MSLIYSVDDFKMYMLRVRASSTASKYADAAKLFVDYCTKAGLDLDHMPPNALSGFVTSLVDRKLASASIHVYLAGVRAYLRWCEGQGLSPVRMHADTPRVLDRIPNRAVRDEALAHYIKHSSKLNEPYRTAMLIMPFCGLRSSELSELRLSDVRRIGLPMKGTTDTKEHLVFVLRGKGGTVRIVPVLLDGAPLFFDFLLNWRQHFHGGEWVFPGRDGGPISTRTLRKLCERIEQEFGSTVRISPHALRRTYANALWECGVDVPTLTSVMGHKSVQTTYDHYLEARPEELARAVVMKDARLVLPNTAGVATSGLLSFLNSTSTQRKPS